MNICVYGASSKTIDKGYIEAGEELGRLIGSRGHALVFGGGASGLMGAVARGVREEKGRIFGVSPRFFDVDGILYDKCDNLFFTETMRERKQKMEDLSDAFVMTPGGVGTIEEFFEILTLKQLGRHTKPIVILNTRQYFDRLFSFIDDAIYERFMTPDNKRLYAVCDTPRQVIRYIENYKANHSGPVSKYKDI